MNLLIVHPNNSPAKKMQKELKYENISADISNPKDALMKIFSFSYQAVMIFHYPPGCDAIAMCSRIKEVKPSISTTICYSKMNLQLAKFARDNGADFVIEEKASKLFWINEVKNACGRLNNDHEIRSIRYKSFVLSRNSRTLRFREKIWLLKNKEFALMEFFMLNAGVPLNRNTIMENVWDRNANIMSNTVDVHISKLRSKIQSGGKKFIKTIPCLGYVFE